MTTFNGQAFAAVQQALSGVEGVRSDFTDERSLGVLGIFIPVVVTAAPLFTVDVSGSAYEVNEATWVPLIARFRPAEDLRLVWVVQADSVRDYVQQAVEGAQGLRLK